jgi:ubiquinone/menaquinone biosynthesis C-methylase UbiE
MTSTSANLDRFSGFADRYDTYRPRPPAVIAGILMQLAAVDRPRLVVDLGSGTGLSTEMWIGRAAEVIGIEPNADMRLQAIQRLEGTPDIRFQDGISSATGLPDGVVDIVTCSQSLHWMEPDGTFREAARILRPGGVFAAYDCDWPPTVTPEAEDAFRRFMASAQALADRDGLEVEVTKWDKDQHLSRMDASGRFRWTKDLAVHHIEEGDAGRLVGIALSQGTVSTLFRSGLSEEEVGVDVFHGEARAALPNGPIPWYWTYRIRVGIV